MLQAGPEPIPARCAEKDLISTLPFVSEGFRDPKGVFHPRKFWCVESTGDYAADCDLGAAYARQALAYMRQKDSDLLLGWVVKGMIEIGHFGQIEVRFLSGIANAAIAVHVADDGAVIVNLPCGGLVGEKRYRARHRRPARRMRPRTADHCHGSAQ
jgi:hypothetical protein